MSTPSHSTVPRDSLEGLYPLRTGSLMTAPWFQPLPSPEREPSTASLLERRPPRQFFRTRWDHPKIALPLFRLPGDRQPRDTAVPALRKQKHQNTPFFSSFPEMSFQGFPTRRVKRLKKGELLRRPVETPLSLCLGQYKHQEHLVFCS